MEKQLAASPIHAEGIGSDLIMRHVEIVGVSPLLMNAMSIETLLGLRPSAGRKRSRTAQSLSPREEAEGHLHKLPDGTIHMPVTNLLASLIEAGKYVRLDGKRQISTKDSTILPGLMEIVTPTLPLVTAKGEPVRWETDVRQGRNPNGGEAVCIIRPRIDDWKFDLTIRIDTSTISELLIRNLFDIAGSRCGLCDFRPQRKGTFGRFVVNKWQENGDA